MPDVVNRRSQQAVSFEDVEIVRHDSPIPYYFQLSSHIERKIKSKKFLPGQLMPSEQEICEQLGISRTVVRQAMAELERKGLITKQSGKRSTVAYPRYEGSLMQNLRGFYEDAVSKGQRPTTRVLELRVAPAEGEVAEALQLDGGDPVIMINRLRFLDGEAEVLVVTYLPEAKCPDLVREDLSNQSLYELLARKYGLVIAQGYRTVEAIALDRADSKLLSVAPGSPALLLKSVGLLADGTPLEYYVAKHRGDRSRFQIYLVRDTKP
jgi:GntR family transcriptional regulator